jgi:tetratricopeptide (TPR) repeat protein
MSSAPELTEGPKPLLVQREDWRRLAVGAVILVLAVFAVYWPALRGPFLWDDFLVVHRNPLVTGELAPGAIWFRMDFPLTYVAFWLEWLAWGNHPAGYHVVNVLLHATGALLLWRVLAQLKVPAPWLAAMIFAVHPVCVASVAWISELKNTLSLPFFMLSLLWYIQFDSPPRPSSLAPRPSLRYFLSLLAFVLALLSKTSTVMLPFVLLACAWWQRGRVTWRDWWRTSPFFALALAFGLMSIWFQTHGAITGATVQSENFWGRLAGAGMALWFYLGKALLPLNLSMIYPRWKIDAAASVSYLPLLLWCAALAVCWGLSRVYSGGTRNKQPQRRGERREPSEGKGAETTHLSVVDSQLTESGMSLRSSRLCGLIGHSPTPTWCLIQNLGRHLLFGLGCFTVTLFPVLGFFDMYFLMLSRVSDHFEYLPLTALVALAAGGLGCGFSRIFQTPEGSTDKSLANSSARSAMSIARLPPGNQAPSGAACGPPPSREPSMPLLPELENNPPEPGDYKHAAPDGAIPTAQGSEVSRLRGRVLGLVVGTGLVVGLGALAMQRAQVFQSEEALWRDTLAKNPAAWCAHANLGWILAEQQKYDEAREHLVASLEVNPDNAQAHSNLGRVLSLQRQYAEAEPHFRAALKLKPNDADIRKSYASALAEQGRRAEAVPQLREALRLRPDTDARLLLATLSYQTRKFPEAIAEYGQVLKVKPDQPEALNNLAWLLATCSNGTARDGAEAVRLAEHACRLSGYKQARELFTLAAAYAEAGRFPEAVEAAQKSIEMAKAGGNAQLAAVGGQLLTVFRAGKPYHEPDATPVRPGGK